MRRITPILAVLALALAAAACGSTDDTANGSDTTAGGDANRTVEIEMQDNKYLPDTIDVADGETIRFVFTNSGTAAHDAFIGDEAAQDDHEMEMNGDMGDGHGMDETDAVTVEPGDTGELTHTFAAGDDVLIGCHEAGHYAGGMRLMIDVT